MSYIYNMGRDLKKTRVLLQMYQELAFGKEVSRQTLLKKFDLAPRTLERYMRDLEELGVRSAKDPQNGRKKIYRLENPIKELRLSDSEVLSLALASSILRSIAPDLGASIYGLIQTEQAEKIPKECMDVYFAGMNLGIDNLEGKILMVLKAIQKKVSLLIDEEIFWPQHILLHEGKWIVTGQKISQRSALNESFRLDKISFRLGDTESTSNLHAVPSSFRSSYGPNPAQKQTKVLLRIHNGRGQQYLIKETWHPSQKIVGRNDSDGTMDFEFYVNDLRYFKFFVRRWLPHAEVLEPQSLRQQIHQELIQALGIYA